jgi:hypothetical protein
VSVLAVVVICVNGIESPAAPSFSAPKAVALSVTLPKLLTTAAVSTPPVKSPPVPATAAPVPTWAAVGENTISSTVVLLV